MDNQGVVFPMAEYASSIECPGLLNVDGERYKIRQLTREIIHSVRDLRVPKERQKKMQRACREAWKLVRQAQAAKMITRKNYGLVWHCMRMSPSLPPEPVKSDDDYRQALVDKYGFLRLGVELEIRQSTQGPQVPSNMGLFLKIGQPPLKKGQKVTFYDGIHVALSEEEQGAHKERASWFISTGMTSDTSAIMIGFTSADTRDTAFPVNAGLMSLCNSVCEGPTCKKHMLDKSGGKGLLQIKKRHISCLPILVANTQVEGGDELLWDYNVR